MRFLPLANLVAGDKFSKVTLPANSPNKLPFLVTGPRRPAVRVFAAQRFWYGPALKHLIATGCLALARVDKGDAFSPPWLPLCNGGRKVVYGAEYRVYEPVLVSEHLQHYAEEELKELVCQCVGILEEAAQKAAKYAVNLPFGQELIKLANESCGREILPVS